MGHRTVRRLSIVACLSLCIGLAVAAFRNPEEAPRIAKGGYITASIVTPTPSPDPEATAAPAPTKTMPLPSSTAKAPKHPPHKGPTPESRSDDAAFNELTKVLQARTNGAHEQGKLTEKLTKELEALESVKPPRMLGITPSAISEDDGRALGLLADQGGIRIENVLPDSVAQSIGLQAGDVVTALDGIPLARGKEVETLRGVMNQVSTGRTAAVKFYRNGVPMTLLASWSE